MHLSLSSSTTVAGAHCMPRPGQTLMSACCSDCPVAASRFCQMKVHFFKGIGISILRFRISRDLKGKGKIRVKFRAEDQSRRLAQSCLHRNFHKGWSKQTYVYRLFTLKLCFFRPPLTILRPTPCTVEVRLLASLSSPPAECALRSRAVLTRN